MVLLRLLLPNPQRLKVESCFKRKRRKITPKKILLLYSVQIVNSNLLSKLYRTYIHNTYNCKRDKTKICFKKRKKLNWKSYQGSNIGYYRII